MAGSVLRIGIAGCGSAARVHLERLLALDNVRVVGCADPDASAASGLAARVPRREGAPPAAAVTDYRELIRQTGPDALAIFTPHLAHYRPTMDALQAGCHVLVENPLSTNVQEAVDVIGLARGHGLKVAVAHQYRLCPGFAEARRRLADGAIGTVRLVSATLARPWLAAHDGTWRSDPRVAGGGVMADAGDHLLDALLWTTGQPAVEAAAVQARLESGLDVVSAVALRLADGTPAAVAVAGVSRAAVFELNYFGDAGRLRVTETTLEMDTGDGGARATALPAASRTIVDDFVSAVLDGTPLCCPADEALQTVRLREAIERSAATGRVVRLS
jgi:predicted dehydrogenase